MPDFFVAGFQKCATTWLYRSLAEHPQIRMPSRHMVHYFDINYHLGHDWYRQQFESDAGELVVGDTTVTYARDQIAVNRMARDAPDARIVLSVRNPIDRAVSHFLHERAKGKTAFSFGEWRENYDCYSDWIVPGFYALHLERLQRSFPGESILVLESDDFRSRPGETLESVFALLGVDTDFRPTTVGRQLNTTSDRVARWRAERGGPKPRVLRRALRMIATGGRESTSAQNEVEADAGLEEPLTQRDRTELAEIFKRDVERLGELTGRSFCHWLESAS
jgi:hypothetical protein